MQLFFYALNIEGIWMGRKSNDSVDEKCLGDY